MHATTNELTDRAQQSASHFAGEREYAGFTDILAELLAGMRLVADQMQLGWPDVRQAAKAIYLEHRKAVKPARTPKAPRAPIPAAAQYRVEMVTPSGETISEERPEAYRFAVLQQVDSVWGVRSRVNTKAVASSRCFTFRKAGVRAEHLKIVEVFPQPIGDAPVVEPPAQPIAKRARRRAEQPTDEVVVEREPIAADLAGQNLAFPGSEKVHAPSASPASSSQRCSPGIGKAAQ